MAWISKRGMVGKVIKTGDHQDSWIRVISVSKNTATVFSGATATVQELSASAIVRNVKQNKWTVVDK